MEGQFKPIGDRVLVRPQEKTENKTASGIILTESSTQSQKVYGEVVSIGTGIFSQNGERIPMTVQVGDIVMYEKSYGTNEIEIGNEKFLLFNEHQLIGIVRK
jgi:chaperonin GroES